MDLPVAIGEIVANKYRIDRLIGTGGMGIVVAAFHLELEQPVAIKFLNSETGARADANERFRREARAAARIRSEHVARVLDIEVLDNRLPYMVMELLEGHDLERELEQAGPLPVAVAVGYVLQAIDAVAEAHATGVVHRDLKPTNLFLAQLPDGRRLIKVLDFGISKLVGPGSGRNAALTRSASIFGSPLYMSPEQMRSAKDVDARADIWSLGAILFELVTGRPPFLAESMPALCMAILNESPPSLHGLVPSAPPELDAVVFKCLAREVNHRFDSVADLAEALVPFAPEGRMHAERARRVLGLASPTLARPTWRSDSELPISNLPRGSTPAAPQVRGVVRPGPGPTQSSWGRTGGRAIVNRRIGTILAAVVLLLGGGLLLARTLSTSEDRTVPQIHAARPSPAPPSAAVAPPVDVPAPPAEPRAAEALPAASAASATASVDARAAKPPSAKPPGAKPQSATSTTVTRDKSARGASGLTDFGGRIY
jgi:eukaryotic-like serine/threonine-protein kinase